MNKEIKIENHVISENSPTYIVAEMSANHNMDFNRAKEIIKAAKESGADAIKIQTYTPDTITIDSDMPAFRASDIWNAKTLYELYKKAYTPWEWQKALKEYATSLGLDFFSSPFDLSAVDFLEELNVPAYKIASFEITDIPFLKYVASKGKPVIISTGIAQLKDIQEALDACKEVGNDQVILLKCTSAYPTPVEDINLKTMVNMKETFDVLTGLSDHTMGSAVSVGAVALGAKVIEKHMTLRREDGGADSKFSMEPEEFKEMIDNIRMIEKALGNVTYNLSEKQKRSREHSRSLFVIKDIKKGEKFTNDNIKSIRPGNGISTRYIEDILGKKAEVDIKRGTPLKWELIKG